MCKQSIASKEQPALPRPVAAAAIVDSLRRPTLLLAARRSYPPKLNGLFELPGGKVEPGETPREALLREIYEELGVRLLLGSPVPGTERNTGECGFAPWPIHQDRVMWVWLAKVQGDRKPCPSGSHSDLTWVDKFSAPKLPWIPADAQIVEAIVSRMGNPG